MPDIEVGGLAAQGRVVDAVADGAVLRGTLPELAGQLGVSAEHLAVAIAELANIGWLALERGSDEQLALRWAEDARGASSAGR